MSSASNKKITLPAIAWEIVRIMVQQPGWATTNKDIVVAGNLDDRIALPEKPKPGDDGKIDPADDKAWSEQPVELELMAKEIACISKCVKHHVEKGALGGSKSNARIVAEFLPEE